MNFSVLIATYFKDLPEALNDSLKSVFKQTLLPNEVIMVVDGFVPEKIDAVLNKFSNQYPTVFKVYRLQENRGLGNALNYGLQFCKYDIVARMDSDDIAVENRFELQFNFLQQHRSVSVIGGFMEEFRNKPGDLRIKKIAPIGVARIKEYSRLRNPLNHPAVMFRKDHVLRAGGYIEVKLFEDYYLWLRMLKNGFTLENLPDIIMNFRVGNDMIGRRHGFRYALLEINFVTKCYRENLISTWDYFRQVMFRIPLRLIPKVILNLIYQKALRKK